MKGDVALDYCQLSIRLLKHNAIVVFWMVIRNLEVDAESITQLASEKFKLSNRTATIRWRTERMVLILPVQNIELWMFRKFVDL